MRTVCTCLLASILVALLGLPSSAGAQVPAGPAAVVRGVLSLPDEHLDYRRAKLAFDRIVDPSIDIEAVSVEIDRLAIVAMRMAAPRASEAERLSALRRTVYESGQWNGNRAFGYDHADPLGRSVRNKLLSSYLATRRGNCVSMPILFLILGERLGLKLALSTAPLHMFLRHTEETGRVINLETTSGAHPARTEWYRQNMPMTDRAIESGLYMRSLSRREAIAHMATTIVEFLIEEGRYQEAIEVSDVILQHYPLDGYTMLKQGTAYAQLMRVEFYGRYSTPDLIPLHLRQRYAMLAQRNQDAFAAAEALGWQPAD